MRMHLKKLFLFFAAAALLCCSLAKAQTDSTEVPRHLAIARELVENIKPEDNQYTLRERSISFPGDIFSNRYAMRADCSGFLLAVFERAKYSTQSKMSFLEWTPNRKKHTAEDFVLSIEKGGGFTRITKVEDLRPGDILAHAMLNVEDKKKTGTTGHVFLINGQPKLITPRKPVVEDTRQFEVSIIDSNEAYTGDDDSRLADPSNKVKGLGKGTIRLYADSSGELVGWATTFKTSTRFFSYNPRFPSETKARKAAMGRPVAGI
jgi:hypothetical protein